MKFKTYALLLAAVCLAPAQQFRGTLTGRVLDAQEAVVPNVKIVATQVDTGASYDAVTGSEGQYTLPFLAPGVPSKRNSYRNRSLRFLDLRLQRNFKLGEKFELSPSFEAFNVLNFKNLTYASATAFNYGNPGINENTGEVLAASNPAFLQLRDATGALRNTNSSATPRQPTSSADFCW